MLFMPVLWLLQTSVAAAPAHFPAAHSAEYTLYKNGFAVASSRFHLQYQADEMSYVSDTELSGLVSLFSNEKITEQSRLTQHGNQIRLQSYSFRQTGDKPQSIRSELNWSDFTVSTESSGQIKTTLPFDAPLWDKLSVNLALMQYVQQNSTQPVQKNVSFNVIDNGEIKSYQFEYMGAREIELHPDEWIKTVIWKRLHGHSSKTTIIYLAPSLQFLPVQLEQYKHDTLSATLKLSQVNW